MPEPLELPELPRRRITLSDTVDKLIAALARGHGDQSSVRLNRNARGDVQIEVTVRTGEPGVETIEDCSLKARQKFDELVTLYPMSTDGNGGTP